MDEKLKEFLQKNEGKTFYTVTNKPFTYKMDYDGFYISRVEKGSIKIFDFNNMQKAFEEFRFVSKPSDFSESIMGKSYCYAILLEYEKYV